MESITSTQGNSKSDRPRQATLTEAIAQIDGNLGHLMEVRQNAHNILSTLIGTSVDVEDKILAEEPKPAPLSIPERFLDLSKQIRQEANKINDTLNQIRDLIE